MLADAKHVTNGGWTYGPGTHGRFEYVNLTWETSPRVAPRRCIDVEATAWIVLIEVGRGRSTVDVVLEVKLYSALRESRRRR